MEVLLDLFANGRIVISDIEIAAAERTNEAGEIRR
jgi:hypothetical protein